VPIARFPAIDMVLQVDCICYVTGIRVAYSSKKDNLFLKPVNAFFRLDRSARVFKPFGSPVRRLAPDVFGIASASELSLDGWREGSLGDTMHKLVLVVSGQIDLEGASGGWVVVPNHLVFIPADRAFIFRTTKRTVLHVAHLEPAICDWHHAGCWVTSAPSLAREMLGHAVRWNSEEARNLEVARQFFRTLSHLCRDWFSKPRIMWLPSAKSPEMRAVVTYVRDHLADATIDGARAATGLSARTLQRRCHEELSFGWREFLREARILRATELLAQGRHSVGSVARSIGFSSLSAFTLAFSKRVGMPPSEFVRQHSAPRLEPIPNGDRADASAA
jgi:AraC-like DNA-binding protein